MRLLAFGLGYSARAVVARVRPEIEAAWGTTRDPARFDAIRALGVEPVLFDSRSPSETAAVPPLHLSPARGERGVISADHVLISIAPDAEGDPVLRHLRDALADMRPASVVYLSTVGVYGDHDGAWVDEASECRPVSARSRERLVAEREWQAFGGEIGTPLAIVRLSGIYGPGRGPFAKIRNGTARRIVKDGQVFNRIHVDDIAQIVEACFTRRADGIFNGTDDEPAPPQIVLDYAAELLGVPPPPEVAYEHAELTPMARTFYGENKRVRNDAIKDELGVQLAYPTFREGLAATLRAESVMESAAT